MSTTPTPSNDTTTTTTGSSNNTNTNEVLISEEVSKRICTHMNDDHFITIYAMAKELLVGTKSEAKITQAILKKVSKGSCTIQVIICTGDLCEIQTVEYPFNPPLQSGSEVRSRLINIHQKVLQPTNIGNIYSVGAWIVLISTILFLLVAHGLTFQQRTALIQNVGVSDPDLVISLATIQPKVINGLLILHLIEADIVLLVAYIAKLKFTYRTMINWFIYVLLYGIIVSIPFFQLVYYQYQTKKEKKKINAATKNKKE